MENTETVPDYPNRFEQEVAEMYEWKEQLEEMDARLINEIKNGAFSNIGSQFGVMFLKSMLEKINLNEKQLLHNLLQDKFENGFRSR